MSSEKKAAVGLPGQSLRFLADSNSWNVNGTPNIRTARHILKEY